ncbi:hypothetical protein PIB30_013223 [Stylosanthes scabra]|uniref:Uncharacterized protein n=1 Tax=Stylosanthes scabra TaxID=79078 RepID=A0ABU6Q7E1_9FABA|nr:hypothetical protein [Stylosanthes scabra]
MSLINDERSAGGVATRGIRIDYAASKDRARQKMSCHKSLQPVQKYRVELGLRNGWALARKSEIPKIASIARARDVLVLGVTKWGGAGAPSGSRERATNEKGREGAAAQSTLDWAIFGFLSIFLTSLVLLSFPWALPLHFGPEIH